MRWEKAWRSSARAAGGTALLAAALLPTMAGATAICRGADENRTEPSVVLNTKAGVIVIALDIAAAPAATRWLADLVNGPVFNPALVGEDAEPSGYYDGLVFDYSQPHIELRTAVRSPASALVVGNEIDGKALGLDKRKIADQVEADKVWSFQVVKAQNRNKRNPRYSDQIKQWITRYREINNPSFLIGVSHLELNRALGYRYQDGLASKPVTRGAVALVPGPRKNLSTPALSIALADLPRRNGRWMVVGRVVKGLAVAELIANLPLSREAPHRSFRPASPVAIQDALVECRAQERGETQ